MLDQPRIAIPLDLPDGRGLSSELTKAQELIIDVESTRTTTVCRRWKRPISAFHAYDQPLKLRHLPILGDVVYIRIRPKRFRCPSCDDHPTTTQRLPWYDPNARHPTAYERHLRIQLVNRTIADGGQKEATRYAAVLGVRDRALATEIDWASVPAFSVLGIDASALKNGQRDFVVIVTARLPDTRRIVLAVVPDRTKATLVDWRQQIPAAISRQIRAVCTDRWDAYVVAVQETRPKARIVIDRDHSATHYHDGADTLRKQELKRRQKERPKEGADQRTHTLWPVRTRKAELEPDERARLVPRWEQSPVLNQADDLRAALTTIFDPVPSTAAGVRAIKRWRKQVLASGLSCSTPFLTLLDTGLDLLANYCGQRLRSGFVEGLNNKIKVRKRRCFGRFNRQPLFQRITLDLEGYRRFSRWHGAHP